MTSRKHRRLWITLARMEQRALSTLSIAFLCCTAVSMTLFISTHNPLASDDMAQLHHHEKPVTLIWRVTPEHIVSLQSGSTFPLRWEPNAEWRGEITPLFREVLLLASPGASTLSERLQRELTTVGITARIRHVGTPPAFDSRQASPFHSIHQER